MGVRGPHHANETNILKDRKVNASGLGSPSAIVYVTAAACAAEDSESSGLSVSRRRWR
jgi:hypothetical protein